MYFIRHQGMGLFTQTSTLLLDCIAQFIKRKQIITLYKFKYFGSRENVYVSIKLVVLNIILLVLYGNIQNNIRFFGQRNNSNNFQLEGIIASE